MLDGQTFLGLRYSTRKTEEQCSEHETKRHYKSLSSCCTSVELACEACHEIMVLEEY
jgi:hypothetical protein